MPSTAFYPAFLCPTSFLFPASAEAPAPVRVAVSEPSSDELDCCSSVSEPFSELSSGSDLAGGGRIAEEVGAFEEAGSLEEAVFEDKAPALSAMGACLECLAMTARVLALDIKELS